VADDPKSDPPTQVDPLIGTVISGKFRLDSLIGRGGMGKIYKAVQLSLNRTVAVKLLNIADKTSNVAEFRERFYREASLCARLSHPNIVTIHDYGMGDGAADEMLWIAMEFLEGKTLMQRVKSNQQLAPLEATAIVLEIARGIREAHKHGIVHRDLKCSNVMLVPDEDGGTRVKILDFGLVKSLSIPEGEEALTLAGGGFLGSPGYMSPEQIQRGKPIDHRTDIYSLGVVFFRCLTGHNPYEGDQAQVLLAHVNDPIPLFRTANPSIDVPLELEALVRRMLQKDPEKRVGSAEEVVRALRDLQESYSWATPRVAPYDSTGSFSKPQILVLDPTPTTGGTIQPVAVNGPSSSPKKARTRLVAAGGIAAAVAVTLAIVIAPRFERHFSPQPPATSSEIVNPPPAVNPPQPAVAPQAPSPTRAADSPQAAPQPPSPSKPETTTAPRAPSATSRTPAKHVAAKPKPAVVSAPAPAPPAPAPKPAPPPAAPVDTGFLSLDTTPWSNVSEGGRALGQTPLVRVKMSEGQHTLTMTTEHGTSRTFTVTIKAGQTTNKRLGLE